MKVKADTQPPDTLVVQMDYLFIAADGSQTAQGRKSVTALVAVDDRRRLGHQENYLADGRREWYPERCAADGERSDTDGDFEVDPAVQPSVERQTRGHEQDLGGHNADHQERG